VTTRNKKKDPHPRKQKNHQKGQTTKKNQVFEPFLVTINISNNERGGPPKKHLA